MTITSQSGFQNCHERRQRRDTKGEGQRHGDEIHGSIEVPKGAFGCRESTIKRVGDLLRYSWNSVE
jgi:hypothetical protein